VTEGIRFFTHGDLDAGVSAVILARAVGVGARIRTSACQYDGPGNIDELVNAFLDTVEAGTAEEKSLVIADIAPTKETCERIDSLKSEFTKLQVFDHHKTTLWAKDGPFAWFEHSGNDACAALMLRRSLRANATDPDEESLVLAADAWDRWQLDSVHRERGEDLNTLFNFVGFNRFVKMFGDFPNADTQPTVRFLVHEAKIRSTRLLEAALYKQIRSSAPRVYLDKNNNSFVLLMGGSDLDVSTFASRTLDTLRATVDYVAVLLPEIGVVSLRAHAGGVDVSAIAEERNGGGHAAAAGFPLFEMLASVHHEALKCLTGRSGAGEEEYG